MPGLEYRIIGGFWQNIADMARISIGDLSLTTAVFYLTEGEEMIFWVIFVLAIMINLVILLNFLVSKAMVSHADASAVLEQVTHQQKTDLVDEASVMLFDRMKTQEMYPKYIILRSLEY